MKNSKGKAKCKNSESAHALTPRKPEETSCESIRTGGELQEG